MQPCLTPLMISIFCVRLPFWSTLTVAGRSLCKSDKKYTMFLSMPIENSRSQSLDLFTRSKAEDRSMKARWSVPFFAMMYFRTKRWRLRHWSRVPLPFLKPYWRFDKTLHLLIQPFNLLRTTLPNTVTAESKILAYSTWDLLSGLSWKLER